MRVKLYRGKYYAVWSAGGKTQRKALRTSDLGTARRRLEDIQRKPVGSLVGDVAAKYLEVKAGAASHESMRYCWQNLKPHFAHLRPDQITPETCQAYAKARKVSPGTIIKDLGFLRTALKGTGAKFWLPPAPDPRDRYLTRGEFERLLAATTLPHIRLFMVLALTTGARASAILGLTWDKVDFGRGVIDLRRGAAQGAQDGHRRAKGRAVVPMNNRARTALLEAQAGKTGDWVVEWGGSPVKSVKRAFREACARADLKGVTPHVLRHTAAVWMIEAGATIEEVARYLGHTDTRTTYRVYAVHSPDHLRKVAAALE